MFLANYSDQLSDLPLNPYIDRFTESNAIAGFLAVRPSQSFHVVDFSDDCVISGLHPVEETDLWINGGFLIMRQNVFDFIRPGEDLVETPFARLVERRGLYSEKYTGFWKSMDTLKDKLSYDELYNAGVRPWELGRKTKGA